MRLFGDRLRKFVKTRFFIVIASAAVFLTVFSSTLAIMGRSDIIKSGVNFISAPFRAAAKFCGDGIRGFSEYFTEYDRLKAENEKLREELAAALGREDDANVAIAENEWLREFLLYKSENEEIELVDLITVGRESGNYTVCFTVNRGTLSGVRKGQAVISAEGLVGYVSEAGLNYAKVSTITNGDVSVGVICERSAVYGTLEADGNGGCKMICDSGDADVAEGDVIATSGKGSVYPYGLRVGRVVKVERDPYTRTLTAYIETFADPDRISRVMAIRPKVESDE